MSIFNSLKNLVVEDDGKTATAPPTEQEPKPMTPMWGSAPTKPTALGSDWEIARAPAQAAPLPAIDPKIRQLLEADINTAARPAFSEFTIANTALEDVIPDERTRFQAAMKTTVARGLTRDQVLVDIDECLQALEKKEAENKAGAAKAREQKVGSKQTKLSSIDVQLKQLEEQMSAAQLDRERLQEEIAKETAAIEQTEKAFDATVAQYREDLLNRKQKIQSMT